MERLARIEQNGACPHRQRAAHRDVVCQCDRDTPLAGEYHRIVTATIRQPHWLPLRLEEYPLHGGPWGPRVAKLVSELNAAEIAADVRQLGDELFPTASVTWTSR
jgi:hypothetical protein